MNKTIELPAPSAAAAAVRLYLGTIQVSGSPHTFFAVLDAGNHADLLRLEKAAEPIIGSVRLPPSAAGG